MDYAQQNLCCEAGNKRIFFCFLKDFLLLKTNCPSRGKRAFAVEGTGKRMIT
jgi:hypothetical protein